MSTVTATNQTAAAAPAGPLIKPHGWIQIALLAALFGALFWDFLFRAFGGVIRDGALEMRGYAWTNPNWSHALVVPLISLYFLHQHRRELREAAASPLVVSQRDARATWWVVLSVIGIGVVGGGLTAGRGAILSALPALETVFAMRLHFVLALLIGPILGYFGARAIMRPAAVAAGTTSLMRSSAGLVLLLMGIALYVLTLGPRAFNNDMFKGYGMIMALGGLVWFICGWPIARITLFPVAYLVFAVKVSPKLWTDIAFALQGIAAKASGVAISVLGVVIDLEAEVTGNTINLYRHGVALGEGLNVAEACSGLRMLMTFIALGVAVAYLARRPWWARLTIVMLTVPIAILVNIGRVTTMGMLYPFKPEWTKGETHIAIGMLMLIPALGLFSLVGWVLNKIVVTEPESQEGGRA